MRENRFRRAGVVLPADLLERVVGLYPELSPTELEDLRHSLEERKSQLTKLAERHSIDRRGIVIAELLMEAVDRSTGYDQVARGLLTAAIRYYLLVDDDEHDLTSPTGFADDQRIVDSILVAINGPDRSAENA